MSKKYELVRDKIALPSGGFFEAVRLALVDFSCLGQARNLDLTGYPHESETHALMSDWAALGVDFSNAERKVVEEALDEGEIESGSGTAGREARRRATPGSG